MKFSSWWIYFLFAVLLVMLAGLCTGSYLLYRQHQALTELTEDSRLMVLRTERLEALVQEQETMAVLSQQAVEEKAAALVEARLKAAGKKSNGDRGKKTTPAKVEAAPAVKTPPEQMLPSEPKSSDRVDLRNIKLRRRGSEMDISFDIANKGEPAKPMTGYVVVVARAQRNGKPWIEAWPPMRLSPMGRPRNFRRGTPFSVQRYRRLKAKLALGDKKFQRLEFLVYSQKGELILVVVQALDRKGKPVKSSSSGSGEALG